MNITVKCFPADWTSVLFQIIEDVGQAHGSAEIVDDITLNGFKDRYFADLHPLTNILFKDLPDYAMDISLLIRSFI